MRYRVRHTTDYHYDAPVSQCLSEIRLTPRALPWQSVIEHAVVVTPEPASIESRTDYFGNLVDTLSILERHETFSIAASSVIDVANPPVVAELPRAWEIVRDEVAAHESPAILEALEFVFDSPYVPTGPELAAYARPSFLPRRPLADAVADLSHRIHSDFTYKPASTTVDTPLVDIVRMRRGVCQDFSHVMIGALRSMGLPARYVSGYLRSGANYQGAEASHAWVSVFAPRAGWMDLDPTNDVVPGQSHVTLAWGRDYGDVTPIKGVSLGGGRHAVKVEVRVEPVDG